MKQNIKSQFQILNFKFQMGMYLKSIIWNLKFGILCVLSAFVIQTKAQTWIWYPGDYEIWLANQMQNRRTDRGSFFPVFWKVDSHYPLMDFHKVFDLKEAEQVAIFAEGQYNVKLDGKPFEGTPTTITVPAGKHKINIKVFNQVSPPTVFVKGKTIKSDDTWLTTFEDKEWIDETGKLLIYQQPNGYMPAHGILIVLHNYLLNSNCQPLR